MICWIDFHLHNSSAWHLAFGDSGLWPSRTTLARGHQRHKAKNIKKQLTHDTGTAWHGFSLGIPAALVMQRAQPGDNKGTPRSWLNPPRSDRTSKQMRWSTESTQSISSHDIFVASQCFLLRCSALTNSTPGNVGYTVLSRTVACAFKHARCVHRTYIACSGGPFHSGGKLNNPPNPQIEFLPQSH